MKYPLANSSEFHGPVTCAESVQFGRFCTVWQYSTICEDARIGDYVVVGSGSWIGRGTVIGDGTRIQHGAFIPNHTQIGKNVFIGPLVKMCDDKYPKVNQPYIPAPPILEDECSIGAGAVILPGVRIGHGAMVGAGAVVDRDVPPLSTVVGVPARVLTHNSVEEAAWN